MANKNLIDPHEFWDRLNKASYDVITYPDREMDCAQFGYYTDTIQAMLNQTKKVDAVEVVHAYWEDGICSNCKEEAFSTSWDEPIYDYDWEENLRYSHTEKHTEYCLTDYCPNCGADMRERETEDDN